MRNRLVREKVKNVGFISTRFKGTDGVSLETSKWAHVLKKMGFKCFYFAGQLDTPEKNSLLEPLADFQHPLISEIYDQCFSMPFRSRALTTRIHEVKDRLKDTIYAFIESFEIHLMVAENSLAIPLNLPLGLAITEVIAETGIQTIGHHHDFFWERKRFLVNSVWDYLNMAFPPHLETVRHVVINSSGDNQLSLRTGISPVIIPNVMDYDHPPGEPDDYAKDVRQALGLKDGDFFILQPTRVVQRKGIEHAIELTHRLGKQAKLVISHGSGDEGQSYLSRLQAYADTLGTDLILAADIVGTERGETADGRKIYHLSDLYQFADLVTFPSTFEGFGNAFLEALYFKKPVLVNNYSVYATDIRPRGFWNIEIDDYITKETVNLTRKILNDDVLRAEMVDHNYEMARRHYSYSILRDKLNAIFNNFFGRYYK